MTFKNERSRKKVTFYLAVILVGGIAFFGRSYMRGNDGALPASAQAEAPSAPLVTVAPVGAEEIANTRKYVGKVEPIQSVTLRSEVAARVAEVHFKDGSTVKAGELLFTLDDRQYRAMVELRKAELSKAEANSKQAARYHERLKNVGKTGVSASDVDTAESQALQAKAAVEQARASLKLAQIDLDNTKITAPISGRIGKAAFTKGNYVTPSDNLTTLVQIDPVRVTFQLSDKDYLSQFGAFASQDAVFDTTLRLATGETYPFSGTRDFEDNAMDDRSGTISVSLRFRNETGLLVPGSMVRLTTASVKTRTAAVVPQEAIQADRDGDFVYVVDENSIAHRRSVTLGAEAGAKREIVSGLEAGEWIVVGGLQSVKADLRVRTSEAGKSTKTMAATEQAQTKSSEEKI